MSHNGTAKIFEIHDSDVTSFVLGTYSTSTYETFVLFSLSDRFLTEVLVTASERSTPDTYLTVPNSSLYHQASLGRQESPEFHNPSFILAPSVDEPH